MNWILFSAIIGFSSFVEELTAKMTGPLFVTIFFLSNGIAKFMALPIRRWIFRRPELLSSVFNVLTFIVFVLFLFATWRYPLAEVIRWPHSLFALLLDLIGWAAWIILARREGKREEA